MSDSNNIEKPIGLVIKSRPNFGGVAPTPTPKPRRPRVGETSTTTYRRAINQGNWLIDLGNKDGKPINEWSEYILSKWIAKYYEFKQSIASLSSDYRKGIVEEDQYHTLRHIEEELDGLFRKSNDNANHAPSAVISEVKGASNHGQKWTPDDEQELTDAYLHDHVHISSLAERFGRTECSIYCKLETLGAISATDNPYHDRMAKNSTKGETESKVITHKENKVSTKYDSEKLNKYIEQFSHLKRSIRNGEPAPHKIILLLTILDLIHIQHKYRDALIPLENTLILAFEAKWTKYVSTHTYNSDISMPYFHMNTEPFWTLITKTQENITFISTPSIRMMQHCYKGARIDVDLLELAQHDDAYLELRNALMKQLAGYATEPKKEEPHHAKQTQPNPTVELSHRRRIHVGESSSLRQHEDVFFDFIVPDFTEVNDSIADVLKKNFKLHNADMVVEVQGREQDPNYDYFEYGYINFASSCMPYITRRIEAIDGGTKYRLFTFERTSYISIKKHPFDFDEAIEHLILSDIF